MARCAPATIAWTVRHSPIEPDRRAHAETDVKDKMSERAPAKIRAAARTGRGSGEALRVLHLSTFDDGGGARSAFRLHQALLVAGVDPEMLVLNRRSADTTVGGLELSRRLFQRVYRRIIRTRDTWRFARTLGGQPSIPRGGP
jgi:hypothetical protein